MDRREVLGLLIGAAVLPIRPAIPPSAGTVVHYADIAAAVQRGLLRPAEAASEFWANGVMTATEARERFTMVADLQFTCDEFVDGRVLEPDTVVVRFTSQERF